MRLHGGWGWAIIAIFVVYWDLYHQPLSLAFERALQHDQWSYVVVIGWTLVTLHLFNAIHPRVDPIHHLATMVTSWN